MRDVAAITGAGHACIAAQGVPDVVIANAGISVGMDTAVLADLEVMRATYETNNLGLAATFHPFVAPMLARKSGTLVGIASVAGIRGLPGHGAYSSSKAGVIAYCESLRGELRASGVRVVTIAPGYIDTPLTQGNRYSMPFLMSAERVRRSRLRGDQRRRPLSLHPLADGDRRAPAQVDAERALRPRPRRPAAQEASVGSLSAGNEKGGALSLHRLLTRGRRRGRDRSTQ